MENNNSIMENNKETRMISSDDVFYAVLKDGTVVSNFREAVESMENEHALDLIGKVLEAHQDFFYEAKTFPALLGTQARILLIVAGLRGLSRAEAQKSEVMANVKADAEQKGETDDKKEDGGE